MAKFKRFVGFGVQYLNRYKQQNKIEESKHEERID